MNKQDNITNNENKFQVPEGYFESFNQRLFLRLELEEELNDFPQLAKLTKRNPFVVPENYFNTLDSKILQQTTNVSSAKVFNLHTIVTKYKFAFAALFVLALGTTLFFQYYNTTSIAKEDTCMELACLSKEDITSSNYFNQISLSELESVAGQDVQDSLNKQINNDLVNDLMDHTEDLDLTDDDIEL